MNFNDILLVSDYDMTLTGSNGEIPRENIDAIEYFIARGGMFTVGTGRAKPLFEKQFPLIPSNAPSIVANGAVIFDYRSGETVKMFPLERDERSAVRALVSRFRSLLGVTLESGFEIYHPFGADAPEEPGSPLGYYRLFGIEIRRAPLGSIPEPWLKAVFTGDPSCEPARSALEDVEAAANSLGLSGARSMPQMYEIQSRSAGKGSAARWLAEYLGRGTLVCAGDAPNDLAMLREADIAFVPENADEKMRSLGYRSSAHADSGTIADIVRTLESI